jgi:hypothetical protein
MHCLFYLTGHRPDQRSACPEFIEGPVQNFCQAAGMADSALIYGGKENQSRSRTPVFGWESMPELIRYVFQNMADTAKSPD